MKASIAAAAFLAATVSAHGNVTSPPARLTGPGMVKACGQTAVSNVLADGTIPLEDVLDTLPSCKLDLCRGAVFADNAARVQQYTLGQVIPFKAQIPISHEGPANVSIVKTATNKILGNMLLVFASYADEKLKVLPANNTNFAVTIPTNLAATDCRVGGECVLQWFWFGTAAKQTYESCVDFVIVSASNISSGAGGGSGTTTSVVSSAVATSAALASSTLVAGVGALIPATATATSNGVGGFSTPTSTPESPRSGSDGSSSTSPGSDGSDGTGSDDGPNDGDGDNDGDDDSSSDDSSSSASTSAESESVPIPKPAKLAEGAFGGTEGTIPEVDTAGKPVSVSDSFGGTQGSIAAVTQRLKRFIRPDDATSRK